MAVKLKENGKFKNLYISNALLFWAKVFSPEKDRQSGKNKYSVTVFVPEADKDTMEDLGVNKEFALVDKTKKKKGENRGQIKFSSEKYPGTEGMYGFSIELDELKKDGKKNTPPAVVLDTGKRNNEGKKIHEVLTDAIGNGSKGNIRCGVYTTKADPHALCLSLNLIEVTDLIPYETKASSIQDDEFGISVDLSDAEAEDFDDVPPFDADEAEDDDDY